MPSSVPSTWLVRTHTSTITSSSTWTSSSKKLMLSQTFDRTWTCSIYIMMRLLLLRKSSKESNRWKTPKKKTKSSKNVPWLSQRHKRRQGWNQRRKTLWKVWRCSDGSSSCIRWVGCWDCIQSSKSRKPRSALKLSTKFFGPFCKQWSTTFQKTPRRSTRNRVNNSKWVRETRWLN